MEKGKDKQNKCNTLCEMPSSREDVSLLREQPPSDANDNPSKNEATGQLPPEPLAEHSEAPLYGEEPAPQDVPMVVPEATRTSPSVQRPVCCALLYKAAT